MGKNEHTQGKPIDTIPPMSARSDAGRLSIFALTNVSGETEVLLVTYRRIGDFGSNPNGRGVGEKAGWRRTHGRVVEAVKGVLVLAFPFLI
jgi:hypothetical protein